MKLAARLYPAPWRGRYGGEFQALLDDASPKWGDVFNIARGAVVMHAKVLAGGFKLAGAVTLVGVLTALAISFSAHGPYVSTSLIRVAAPVGRRSVDPDLPDAVNLAWQNVLSHYSLGRMIQRPDSKLYTNERMRKPLEDVVEEMRQNIHIERAAAKTDQSAGTANLRISFSYPDKAVAAEVTRGLTFRFLENYAKVQGHLNDVENPIVTETSPSPLPPDRLGFLSLGARLSLIAGTLIAFLRFRTAWTLKVLGFGVAGLMASIFLCVKYAGYLPVQNYTSDAVVRITSNQSDDVPQLLTDAELTDWLRRTQAQVLNDARMKEIILRPTLDLYSREREQMPLDKVIAKMRQNLSILPVKSRSSLRITFSYPERAKAQDVVAAIYNEFGTAQQYRAMVAASKSTHWSPDGTLVGCAVPHGWDYECINNFLAWQNSTGVVRHGASLDVVDPASLPERALPATENLAIAGAVMSMLLGAFLVRSRPSVIASTAH
ncbi:MAG TPA: hypothetical protein VGL72_30340 [Bryobacteraceae bacterium]|jgi:hypothetical protein